MEVSYDPSFSLFELLSTGESIDHIKCPFGLVEWDHVAGVPDQHQGEVSHRLGVPSQIFAHICLKEMNENRTEKKPVSYTHLRAHETRH